MTEKLIDVDGCRLSTRIVGTGAPAVVMLSSAGGAHGQWDRLIPLLNRTCVTYGRPGLSGSDPLPPDQARSATTQDFAARQLYGLLKAAGVPAPYVLASCSIGGWIADRFAVLWPEEVAGLVNIDSTPISPLPLDDPKELVDDADDGTGLVLSYVACCAQAHAEPPEPVCRSVLISRADGTIPPDVIAKYWGPMTSDEADEVWRARQREWARRLRAVHVIADSGGHHVHFDQPQLVALIVESVAQAARRGEPLDLRPDDIAAAGGRLVARPEGLSGDE